MKNEKNKIIFLKVIKDKL